MRKLMRLPILMFVLVIGVYGCFDRESLFRPTGIVEPTPPESTWVERCDTTWTERQTKTAAVNTTTRTATRIELLNIACDHNLIHYGAVVTYSDSYDQTLRYYLEQLSGNNDKYYLADSLGRTTIPQPTNYRGKRYMLLTTENIPAGAYALRMYYTGTISSPTMALPTSVYGTNWYVEAPIDTIRIGCIDCRLIKVPK